MRAQGGGGVCGRGGARVVQLENPVQWQPDGRCGRCGRCESHEHQHHDGMKSVNGIKTVVLASPLESQKHVVLRVACHEV
eukprot:280742-Chlamydomonas_euryale.AAC.1